MKKRLHSLCFTGARIIIGLAIAFFLISKTMEEAKVTPADLWAKISQANPLLLLLAMSLYGVVLMLGAWRWRLLLNAQHISSSWLNAFRLTLIGFFFNLAVPGAVGGDVAKMGYLAKMRKGQATEGVFSIIVDRLFGVFGLFVVASISVLAGWPLLRGLPPESAFIRQAAIVVALGSVAGIAALLVMEFHATLLNFPGIRNLWPVAARITPQPVSETVIRLVRALDIYRKNKPVLGLAFLISLCVHTLLGAELYVVGRAMAERTTPARGYFLTTQVANAVAAVPVTPGGVGLRDKSSQEFLSAFGMSAELAAIIPLAVTVIILVWAMIGLVVFIIGPSDTGKD
ncbi:MAG: lysylphosphatidylglycerol synthase transmembrane domain-containing protein [Lentisphaeria bacterium]|nr:lysylphosphatidylglycerol synthase transmembrane domain-containing protein [Lentisphaeria bacterium]